MAGNNSYKHIEIREQNKRRPVGRPAGSKSPKRAAPEAERCIAITTAGNRCRCHIRNVLIDGIERKAEDSLCIGHYATFSSMHPAELKQLEIETGKYKDINDFDGMLAFLNKCLDDFRKSPSHILATARLMVDVLSHLEDSGKKEVIEVVNCPDYLDQLKEEEDK